MASNEKNNIEVESEELDPAKIAEAIDKGIHQSAEMDKMASSLLESIMKGGKSIQEVLGIDSSASERIYDQAYRFYQGGRYIEASRLFRTLILVRADDMRFAFGLASCFHMLKEYNHAVEAYIKCSLIDPKDPLPFYHASDCYLHLENLPAAIVSLEVAAKLAEKIPEHAALRDRALLAIKQTELELQRSESGGE